MLNERARRTTGIRQRQKERTRAALLAAARRVLREGGYQQATTRAISREAKVATGTFFAHFKDAGALVEALLDERLGKALDEAQATLPPRGTAISRLVHVSLALFESYAKDPALSRAALQGSLFEAAPAGPSARRMAEFRAWVTQELALGQRRGELGPLEPTLGFLCFFSLYFSLLVAGLRGELERDEQKRLLTAGLRRLVGKGLEP